MDKGAWYIAASTSIGGTLGWLSAKIKVADLCSSNGYNECTDSYDADTTLMMITSFVYPSSILLGLVFGLLFGVLLAFFISSAPKEEAMEEENPAGLDDASIAVRTEKIRCKHWISSEARCPNTHTNSKYCDEHMATEKSILFREASI